MKKAKPDKPEKAPTPPKYEILRHDSAGDWSHVEFADTKSEGTERVRELGVESHALVHLSPVKVRAPRER